MRTMTGKCSMQGSALAMDCSPKVWKFMNPMDGCWTGMADRQLSVSWIATVIATQEYGCHTSLHVPPPNCTSCCRLVCWSCTQCWQNACFTSWSWCCSRLSLMGWCGEWRTSAPATSGSCGWCSGKKDPGDLGWTQGEPCPGYWAMGGWTVFCWTQESLHGNKRTLGSWYPYLFSWDYKGTLHRALSPTFRKLCSLLGQRPFVVQTLYSLFVNFAPLIDLPSIQTKLHLTI